MKYKSLQELKGFECKNVSGGILMIEPGQPIFPAPQPKPAPQPNPNPERH